MLKLCYGREIHYIWDINLKSKASYYEKRTLQNSTFMLVIDTCSILLD